MLITPLLAAGSPSATLQAASASLPNRPLFHHPGRPKALRTEHCIAALIGQSNRIEYIARYPLFGALSLRPPFTAH